MRNISLAMNTNTRSYREDTVLFRTEREYRHHLWKIRRKRQMRNRLLMALFTVCLIVTLAFSYSAIVSHAETTPDQIAFKYFTKVEVEYGDTLWSIAEEYKDADHYSSTMSYINEVKRINNMYDDALQAGDSIIVPYYSYEYQK